MPQKKTSKPKHEANNHIEEVEEQVSEWGVQEYLDKLIKLKCDRFQILLILSLIKHPFFLHDNVEKMIGISKKKAQTVIKRLLKCADDIAYFNKQLVAFMWGPDGNWPRIYKRLPQLLRSFAINLSVGTKIFGPKKHPAQMAAKWLLVEYVKTTTKRFCDREVSRLIAAVTENENYVSLNHRIWRREYAEELSKHNNSDDISYLAPASPPPFPKP